MLGATLLFIFGKKLIGKRESSVRHDASARTLATASFFLFLVAIYGGYFGGGLGIVLLALLGALGMTDIHAMNAFKTVLERDSKWPSGDSFRAGESHLLAASYISDDWFCCGRISRRTLWAALAPGPGCARLL